MSDPSNHTNEDDPSHRKLRYALIEQLYAQSRAGVIGAQVSAVVLLAALWKAVPHWHLWTWLAIYSLIQVHRNWLVFTFRKSRPPDAEMEWWGRALTVDSVLSGLVWGMAGVFLFPEHSAMHQFLLALFLAGISSAAAVVYSPLTECFLPTVAVEIVPIALNCLYQGDYVHIVMGLVMLVFLGVLVSTARLVQGVTIKSLKLGFENTALVGSLTEQKARAEELNLSLQVEMCQREIMQASLAASEERLELALTGADLGLWDCNMKTHTAYYDNRWAEMLGHSIEEIEPVVDSWLERLHPEDLSIVSKAYESYSAGLNSIYEAEFRLRMKSGQYKWILTRGKVVEADSDGKPIRITGTHLDIDSRKATEQRIKDSLREKEVLLREIHHRVKNNLQVMCSLLSLQARTVSDQTYKALLRESENRVKSMALVHEKLYQSDNMAELGVRPYLAGLTNHVMGSYSGSSKRIRTHVNADHISIGVDIAIPMGLLVTELLSNSVKHAFPDEKCGNISIALQSIPDNLLELVISDDGEGIPQDSDSTGGGLGHRLIGIFVQQLQGEMHLSHHRGTTTRVVFPRG